jgi:hypothetical protein
MLEKNGKLPEFFLKDWEQAKKRFQRVLSEICNIDTPRYIAREKYELCLAKNEYTLGAIYSALRKCTPESIKNNEGRIRDYYRSVCKFDKPVVDMILSQILNRFEIPEHYMRIYADIPRDKFANEEITSLPPEIHKEKDCIKLYIYPGYSKEDVKWFIDHKLRKSLPDNSKARNDLRISRKGFVERMLIGNMSNTLSMSSKSIERLFRELKTKFDDDDFEPYDAQSIESIRDKSRRKYADVFSEIEKELHDYESEQLSKEFVIGISANKKHGHQKYSYPFRLTYFDKDKKFHLEKA